MSEPITRRRALQVVAGALLLAGCGGVSEFERSALGVRVDSLADAVFAFSLSVSPEYGTILGLSTAEHGRIRDNSPAAIRAAEQREDALYRVALTIDPAPLAGRPQWVTYAVLREQLEAARATRICRGELWGVASYVNGWQAVYTDLAMLQPVGTEPLRALALARVRALPGFLAREITNLREGLRLGYSAPTVIVVAVVGQLDDILATPPRRSPFFSPAQRDPTPVFQAELARVIAQELNPAIRRYRDFLMTEYLPAARETLGVSANPDGAVCYRAVLRGFATVEIDPDTVFAMGQGLMAQIRGEMRALAARSFGGESLGTLLPRLRTDPRYTYRTSQEIIDTADAVVARARAAMGDWFGRLPEAGLVVQPYPEFRQRSGAPGQYQPAPDDGARPAIFLINPSEPTRQSRAHGETLAMHEGIPGHHLQVGLARERADLHPLSRNAFSSGFGEGWALYAERLGEEMGLYSGDLGRMGLLASEAWRAARMVLDAGLHLQGWTREQALAYLKEHTLVAPRVAEGEIDRYISWPGQAPSYMIGRQEILRLREHARGALGDRFDIRAFHDRVLEDGTVPLAALRTKIETWVAGGPDGRTARPDGP